MKSRKSEDQNSAQKKEYILTEDEITKLVDRKIDFLAGKTTARPWSEIKQRKR